MRYFYPILIGLVTLLNVNYAMAQWKKVNDVDYIWGPFKIYNVSLFTESGNYTDKLRPIMLSFKYEKPVDGRDFAISLVRSWSNLGINLQQQDQVIDRLRKILPNIKAGDILYYIALEDKGYFMLNDMIIDQMFERDFNDAIVSIWLDAKVEIGRKLVVNKSSQTEREHQVIRDEPPQNEVSFSAGVGEVNPDEALSLSNTTDQAVEKNENLANASESVQILENKENKENKETLPQNELEIEIHLPSDPVSIEPKPLV